MFDPVQFLKNSQLTKKHLKLTYLSYFIDITLILFQQMSSKRQRLIQGFQNLLQGKAQYIHQSFAGSQFHCRIREHFEQELNQRYPSITWQYIVSQFEPNQYLPLPSQMLGKRSSEILASKSRKLCLKMIDKQTFQHLNEIFSDILKFKDKNPQHFLIDIYKIIEIRAVHGNLHHEDYYILMPSIRRKFETLINVYDIKGYTEARRIDKAQYQAFKFGKDQNFIQNHELQLLSKIKREKLEGIADRLIHDIRFLEKENIIDYSILISFHQQDHNQKMVNNSIQIEGGVAMELAIIDYFQNFTKKKMVEKSFKSLFRKEISSVEPDRYADRMCEFVHRYFLNQKSQENQ